MMRARLGVPTAFNGTYSLPLLQKLLVRLRPSCRRSVLRPIPAVAVSGALPRAAVFTKRVSGTACAG